jgi:DNA-binding PadR family transcriptional regulator
MRCRTNTPREHGHGRHGHGRHEHAQHGHDDQGHDRRHFARAARDGWDDGGGPDHGRHGGRMRDGMRHGGRRRVFDHGDLRLVVLQLIAEQPRHGYEIIKAIEELVGGAYSPSPGVVYPTLTMLEELGHVTVAEQDGKKLHTVTTVGQDYLAGNRQAVQALQARMAQVAAARAEDPPPSVIRATENLRLALRLKLREGGMTAEQARAIAAALDAAANAVEQA